MIQVYTGAGKGKTTAALGLALRAAGAGLKVYFGQFVKGSHYSELRALKNIGNIKVEQFGRGCFIKESPAEEDKAQARAGLNRIKEIIVSRRYAVVIMDEINVALRLNLVELGDVLELVKKAPKDLELILTGRDAPEPILMIADLVSEIKEIKHYFSKGVQARRGIEY